MTMKYSIQLGCVLLLVFALHGSATADEAQITKLLRGIYLTNSTIESTSPSTLKLGQLEVPSTDLHLVAEVRVQTACIQLIRGIWTNKTVRFTVRIAEDPSKKACYELARDMCEHWKNAEQLAEEERGTLPQFQMVFPNGTNYSLLIQRDDPNGDNYLWYDGRIIQECGIWAGNFHGELATFTINGKPRDLYGKSLSPHKIMRLFKRGAFGRPS
jgi:hypothetical protein